MNTWVNMNVSKEKAREYRAKYKAWKVDLPVKEKEEYDAILEKKGMSKADFLRHAFEEFKKKR